MLHPFGGRMANDMPNGEQAYPYSHTECDRRLGGWGAKASEQVDQSNDLNPISAIDLAKDLAKYLTIDLAKI